MPATATDLYSLITDYGNGKRIIILTPASGIRLRHQKMCLYRFMLLILLPILLLILILLPILLLMPDTDARCLLLICCPLPLLMPDARCLLLLLLLLPVTDLYSQFMYCLKIGKRKPFRQSLRKGYFLFNYFCNYFFLKRV